MAARRLPFVRSTNARMRPAVMSYLSTLVPAPNVIVVQQSSCGSPDAVSFAPHVLPPDRLVQLRWLAHLPSSPHPSLAQSLCCVHAAPTAHLPPGQLTA